MKLGINGFGRIGRLVMRAALDNPDAIVVAINDPFLTVDYAAYLLKHDSVHGKYEKEITYDETHLIIGDVKVRFFSERNPAGKLDCSLCSFSHDSTHVAGASSRHVVHGVIVAALLLNLLIASHR
jgi:glyceraldehyde-3-phosphate dehydrogenase/erythrose-4-phosphate dehydrogenase